MTKKDCFGKLLNTLTHESILRRGDSALFLPLRPSCSSKTAALDHRKAMEGEKTNKLVAIYVTKGKHGCQEDYFFSPQFVCHHAHKVLTHVMSTKQMMCDAKQTFCYGIVVSLLTVACVISLILIIFH